jgi:hypothetical protein
MSSRALIGVLVVAAAATGFAAGGLTRGAGLFGDADREPSTGVDKAPGALDSASSRAAAADGVAAGAAPAAKVALAANSPAAAEETARLRERVAALERELASRAKPDGSTTAGGPTFTFGESGKLAAIREADWKEMGESTKVVGDALVEIMTRTEAGQPVDRAVYMRIQENVERVRKYEYRTIDKIPTAAPHNGELTHPISITNVWASMLSAAGAPLSAVQVADFDRLGMQFEDAFARMRAGWTDDVPRVRRVLDEFRLKRKVVADLYAALTAEQRPLLGDEKWRGVAGVDLFDPTLMVIHNTTAVTGVNAAEIRGKIVGLAKTRAGIGADAAAPRLEAAVDRFVERTTRALEPVPRARVTHYTADEAQTGGEATVDLVEALLRDGEAPAASRRAILDDPQWYVPRIVASS